ncbi:MAG: hypothetical protein LUF00_01050 [Lachnospiraceae bacterium]|nr:hypothetical protein [Lachnospiraceae bacterium]
MIWEWKKILSNRYIVLLLLALIVLNVGLYYGYCTGEVEEGCGYTMSDIREMYEAYLDGEALDGNNVLEQATLVRIEEAEGYAETLQEMADRYQVMLKAGSFSKADSFSFRTLQRSTEVYQALADISPEVSFSGGIECLTGWRLTDLLLCLFAVCAGMILVVQERADGCLSLLRPLKKGHAALYLYKFSAMLTFMLACVLVLYGTNYLLAGLTLGIGDLSRPVQSVYGFTLCPIAVSVGTYLVIFAAQKCLWGLAVGALFFLLCECLSQTIVLFAATVLLSAAAVFLGQTANLWLRALSPFFWEDTAGLYQNCIFMNFLSYPVWQVPVILLLQVLSIGLSLGFGALADGCTSPIAVDRSGILTGLRLTGRRPSVSMLFQEAKKLLRMHGGAVLLLLLIVVQVFSYRNFDTPNDVYYRQYAEVLNGAPDEEKDAWLQEEAEYFASIHEQIGAISEQYGDEPEILESLLLRLESKLEPESGFEEALEQYESLGEGEYFVYASGYGRLFRGQGIRDDCLNTGKLFLVLILALSGLFAVEYETGVQVHIVTAGKEEWVARNKRRQSLLYALLAMGVAYLPQYIMVARNYTLPMLWVPAGSLSVFGSFPAGLPVWTVFVLVGVIRCLVGGLAVGVILFFSRTCRKTTTTILLSSAVLLLPVAIGVVGMG